MSVYVIIMCVLCASQVWAHACNLHRGRNPVSPHAEIVSLLLNVGLIAWGVWLVAKG